MNTRQQMIECLDHVPPLPATAISVISLLQDADADLAAVDKVISHDAGLAANVLRLANSSLFGGNGEVDSIQEALVRLGTKNILPLVLWASVAPVAKHSIPGYDLRDGIWWEHSVAVAIATVKFAGILELRPPSYAFTAALLHDIGKVVMGTFVQKDRELLNRLAFQEGMSFDCAEKAAIGIDHAEIGSLLVANWNMPEPIVQVVRWHHQPENCPEEYHLVASLVHVADYACTTTGFGGGEDGTNYVPCSPTIERLGITNKILEAAMCDTAFEVSELRSEFVAVAGS